LPDIDRPPSRDRLWRVTRALVRVGGLSTGGIFEQALRFALEVQPFSPCPPRARARLAHRELRAFERLERFGRQSRFAFAAAAGQVARAARESALALRRFLERTAALASAARWTRSSCCSAIEAPARVASCFARGRFVQPVAEAARIFRLSFGFGKRAEGVLAALHRFAERQPLQVLRHGARVLAGRARQRSARSRMGSHLWQAFHGAAYRIRSAARLFAQTFEHVSLFGFARARSTDWISSP
jgi:hypothetical protein